LSGEEENMPSDLKTDLLALIPSLRAFAFSLTQNLSDADDLVHSALIEIWSRQAANRDQNLRGAAFAAVHGRFMQMNLVSQLAMACLRRERFATSNDTFAATFRRLPRTVREAISLVVVCGFGSEQEAEICRCDVETIERRVAIACNRLSQHSVGTTFDSFDPDQRRCGGNLFQCISRHSEG
jgi:RNA polymerase sigma-70 factor (ECF subfamily)